jgi:hypothetical protein
MDSELDKVVEEIQQYQLTDTRTIKERKKKILDTLFLEPELMKHYQSLLLEYRYVDEVDELRMGSYIRFFRLNTDPDFLTLGRGAFLADIKIQKHVIILLMKNRNYFFNLKMDECILFQKNTNQEKVLIQILDQIKR